MAAPCVLPCTSGSCSNVWVHEIAMDDCNQVSESLGCGACKSPAGSQAILQQFNHTTGLVTLCPASILLADGPYSCTSPHHGMWCEQAQTAGTLLHQAQPLNTLTSLAGVALGLYGLHAAQTLRGGYHRTSCCLMVLAGIGSAVHHSLPLVPFSHAMDWVPMLGLVASSTAYAVDAAAHRCMRGFAMRLGMWSLSPCAVSTVKDIILFLGLAYAAVAMVTYHEQALGKMSYQSVLLLGAALQVVSHGSIAVGLMVKAWGARSRGQGARPRRGREAVLYPVPCTQGTEAVLVRVYMSTLLAFAAAVLGQRVEYSGCPSWLVGKPYLNAHALWHLAIFYTVHSCISVLLILERGEDSVKPAGVCTRLPPWLLIRVRVLPASPNTLTSECLEWSSSGASTSSSACRLSECSSTACKESEAPGAEQVRHEGHRHQRINMAAGAVEMSPTVSMLERPGSASCRDKATAQTTLEIASLVV